MALLGKGAMVFWHDVAADSDADYQDWHAHEHLAERVGIPGFQRGRRYIAVDGAPRYFIMYEVDALAVLTSADYLAQLNDPTPWTTRALGHFRNSNRTLCQVAASHGLGIGGLLLTLQLAPAPGRGDDLDAWLADGVLAALAGRSGLNAAHLLRGDEAASQTETAEKKLRDRPDAVADRVVLVEGYDEAALAAVRDGDLSATALREAGAAGSPQVALYRLLNSVSTADLGTA